jgi:hypothetical protein
MWLSYALNASTFVSMDRSAHAFTRARYTEEKEEQKKSDGFFLCCFPTPVVEQDMSYRGSQGADLDSWYNLKLLGSRLLSRASNSQSECYGGSWGSVEGLETIPKRAGLVSEDK